MSDAYADLLEMDLEELGGMSPLEVDERREDVTPVPFGTIQMAVNRLEQSGVLELLATWRTQDATAAPGGRPALLSDRAIIVGLMVLAHEHQALLMRKLALLLRRRVADPRARDLLGLPRVRTGTVPAQVERNRWEKNTHNAFHRLLALMDPYPIKRHRAYSFAEIAGILKAHDTELQKTRKMRLDLFTNKFLHMTYLQIPRRIRKQFTSTDISVDQSFIHTPNRAYFNQKKLDQKVAEEATRQAHGEAPRPGIVDPFTGLYPTGTMDRPDNTVGSVPGTGLDNKKYKNLVNGWTINSAVLVDAGSPTAPRLPKITVAMTMSIPTIGAAEEAVSLMRHLVDNGHDGGVVDGDMNYFALSLPERLHIPTAALGFTPSTDYRDHGRAKKEAPGGAFLLHGHLLCPGTPDELTHAVDDWTDGRIDEDTFRARAKTLKAFELHRKEKPDAKGRAPYACPALGASPTVTCPLRELAKKASTKIARPEVHPDDVPEILDAICTQHSVSMGADIGIRERQAFDYYSEEWQAFHQHARQSVESMHSEIKDKSKESAEDAGRRLVRGFAAAQVFETILMVNYNLRKIAAFLYDERDASREHKTSKHRRRDREFYNPYTGTTPPGMKAPADARHRDAGKRPRTLRAILQT